MARKSVNEDEMVSILRDRGYVVKRRAHYILRTFQIEKELLKDFLEIKDQLQARVKDCINDAISTWVVIKKAELAAKKKEGA